MLFPLHMEKTEAESGLRTGECEGGSQKRLCGTPMPRCLTIVLDKAHLNLGLSWPAGTLAHLPRLLERPIIKDASVHNQLLTRPCLCLEL